MSKGPVSHLRRLVVERLTLLGPSELLSKIAIGLKLPSEFVRNLEAGTVP